MVRRNPRTDPRPGDATDGATVLTLRRPETPSLPGTDVEDGYHPALPVEQIDPNPKNVRRDLGDLDELAASIAAVGVRHPITVTPVVTGTVTATSTETAHRYVLVDGHRRYAAACAAGLTTVPVIVRTDISGDVDVLTEMLRAGLLQQQLSPIEEATAYAQLEILGLPRAEIARRVGRSRSTVDARLHLMDLPEAVRERVHERAMTLDEAAVIAEFSDLVERWPAAKDWVRTLQGSAGGRDWQFTVNRARGAWEGEQKRQAARELIAALGVLRVNEDDVPQSWGKRVQESWYCEAELAEARDAGGETAAEVPAAALAHRGCPDAAAAVSVGGYITWLCRRPEQHGGTQGAGDVDEELGGPTSAVGAVPYVEADPFVVHAALLRDWTTHEQASCQAAAVARHEWLRDVLLPGRKPLSLRQADAIALFVAEQLATFVLEVDPTGWLNWLDIELDDDADAEQRLAAALRSARDPQRALVAGLASEQERPAAASAVRNWATKTGPLRDVRAWLQLLQALGYEPCSWEAQYLAEPTGACRVCGCTEDAACTDDPLSACWWVVPDLCSSCARKAIAAAQEAGEDG